MSSALLFVRQTFNPVNHTRKWINSVFREEGLADSPPDGLANILADS